MIKKKEEQIKIAEQKATEMENWLNKVEKDLKEAKVSSLQKDNRIKALQ